MTIEKPLPWLRIEAADEARCDTIARFNKVDPDWKMAKKEMNDSEEALLDATSAARERFPDSAYDEETSKAMNRLTQDHEEKCAKFRKLDSRRRSLQDEMKKLTDRELKMISEAREPGIFDGGDKLGPDGWKRVRLRDLTGGPDPDQDLEKQVWTAAELESHGYDTLDQFLKGRGRMIPALVDDAEVASGTLEKVDAAVYRFLERRNMLDRWPEGVDAPSGEQMTILQAPKQEPAQNELDGDAPFEEDQPAPKPGGSLAFSVKLPSPRAFHADKETQEAAAMRSVKLSRPWEKLAEDQDDDPATQVLAALTGSQVTELENAIGRTPYELLRKLEEYTIADTIELPDVPISSEQLGSVAQLWLTLARKLGMERGGFDYDETTQFVFTNIIERGADCVRAVSAWCPDLGAEIASYRDSDRFDPEFNKPKAPAEKKGKTTKKKATTKKTAKKKASTKKKAPARKKRAAKKQ